MFKPLQIVAASLLVAASAAQAASVVSSQGVTFTYDALDADSFTLRIQNAPAATGNWGPATHLGFLAFKDLGSFATLSGVQVSLDTGAGTSWSFTTGELTGQGCGKNKVNGLAGLCIDAPQDLQLSNDMLLTVNLQGTGIQLSSDGTPHLKVGFTALSATGNRPASYALVGDLLSQPMATSGVVSSVPEPASVAMLCLGLAVLGAANRRRHA